MASRPHRRQVLLFLVAVVVPSLVLLVLTLRMIGQERELADKRALEEQRRRAGEIRRELLARLERLRLEGMRALAANPAETGPANYSDPDIVLLVPVENGRLMLPWETNGSIEQAQRLLNEAVFGQRIQQGESEEFAANQFDRAASLYRLALRGARHPAQAAYAELLLARALTKRGLNADAAAHYKTILSAPLDVIDEEGVPLCLYAAERLVEPGQDIAPTLSLVNTELESRRWLTPTECYITAELLDRLVAASGPTGSASAKQLRERVQMKVRETEHALALQNDFPTLNLTLRANQPDRGEPLWVPYGTDTWLVSMIADVAGRRQGAIAVRFEPVLASLESANARTNQLPAELVMGSDARGEPLGNSLPGLRVQFAGNTEDVSRRWSLQRSFYLAALLLVLSITTFGAYLLWRDVRREMRLVELRSQFVSSVSHELKTPLTAIRMFAETLRMGRASRPETQNEYLDTIVDETERLTRLLNNVLDFSRIEQGKKSYQPASTSLAEVVQTSARAFQHPLAQQGFELRVTIASDVPPVQVDRDALQQAILNLLSNAMKYSPGSRDIDLRLQSQNGEAVIQVTDRGIGIAPEEQNRIFEKFYRSRAAENRLIPGTGLGLTLVEHMAKAHGGRVEVESALGRGSAFSIYLPLADNPNPAWKVRGKTKLSLRDN